MIIRSFAKHIRAATAITALTSNIRAVVLYENDEGGITFQQDDDEGAPILGGSNSLRPARVHVDCYDKDYDQVRTLAAAVRATYENFSGLLDADTVQRIDIARENDIFETETKLHRVSILLTIWFNP